MIHILTRERDEHLSWTYISHAFCLCHDSVMPRLQKLSLIPKITSEVFAGNIQSQWVQDKSPATIEVSLNTLPGGEIMLKAIVQTRRYVIKILWECVISISVIGIIYTLYTSYILSFWMDWSLTVSRFALYCSTSNSNHKKTVTQIPQCTGPIYHNTPFCNITVHVSAHFCYKMVYCGIFV